MIESSCSISTFREPHGSCTYSLSFVCAACSHRSYATIERKRDGTVLWWSRSGLTHSQLSRYSLCSEVTGGEKVLISCDYCAREMALIRFTKNAGTSFTLSNLNLPEVTAGNPHESALAPWNRECSIECGEHERSKRMQDDSVFLHEAIREAMENTGYHANDIFPYTNRLRDSILQYAQVLKREYNEQTEHLTIEAKQKGAKLAKLPSKQTR
jgi:hypothetical protein